MGISKTVKVGKQEFVVREMTLREIKELTEKAEGNPIDALGEILTKCTTAKPDDLADLPPSEYREFTNALLEVNKDFFDIAEAVNMGQAAAAIKTMIQSVFLVPYSGLSNGGTE